MGAENENHFEWFQKQQPRHIPNIFPLFSKYKVAPLFTPLSMVYTGDFSLTSQSCCAALTLGIYATIGTLEICEGNARL